MSTGDRRFQIRFRSEEDDTRELVMFEGSRDEEKETVLCATVASSSRILCLSKPFISAGERAMIKYDFESENVLDLTNSVDHILESGETIVVEADEDDEESTGWKRQAVQIGQQWGFLGEDGDLVIETEFEDVGDFDPETERVNVTYRTKRTQESGDVYSIGLDGGNRKLETKGVPKVQSVPDPAEEPEKDAPEDAPKDAPNLDDVADGLGDE